jgi:mannose-6-phosphate isomerase-like protein (cupin superfamily)
VLIRRFEECAEITANDGCRLRELLHPEKDGSGISYSLAVARVEPGRRTHPHRLIAETEVYFVLGGAGRMWIDGESGPLGPGDAVVIPAGATQWVECTGGEALRFVALVNPPWREDHDRRVEDGSA